jgi:hypothetical protein
MKRCRLANGLSALVGAVIMGLVPAALVGAAGGDRAKIHYTSAGQSAARAVVIKRADLGPTEGWTGGSKKPDLSPMKCSTYSPKQSDLVVVGAAESEWTNSSALTFDSQGEVLATARMVALDWRRSVVTPHLIPCLKESFDKEKSSAVRLVSIRRIAFPRITARTAAIRIITDDTIAKTQSIRVVSDVVTIGRGRTEITLMAVAPLAEASAVRQAEIRLVRLLTGRAVA